MVGCSAIKARNITNDLKQGSNMIDRVGIVCGAGDMLGIDNAAECVKVIKTLKKHELPVIYDTANCIDDYKGKANVQKCIDAVEGWASIAERLL